jgi:targeting protein for Xklp2
LHDTKKTVATASPFVPLAVKVQQFEKTTPERFRGKPKAIKRMLQNKLTQPKSPMLTTRLRAKQTKSSVKSREEVEAEEMQKVKAFKARPLNRKVLMVDVDFGIKGRDCDSSI